MLEANGYTNIAVLSSDDQIVTASATSIPSLGIILSHIDLPPMPAQLAPVGDLTQTRAGGRR